MRCLHKIFWKEADQPPSRTCTADVTNENSKMSRDGYRGPKLPIVLLDKVQSGGISKNKRDVSRKDRRQAERQAKRQSHRPQQVQQTTRRPPVLRATAREFAAIEAGAQCSSIACAKAASQRCEAGQIDLEEEGHCACASLGKRD